MMKWRNVHEESPRGDLTITAYLNTEQNRLLFVRNSQGLAIGVYASAERAIDGHDEFVLAEVCYGWYTLLDRTDGYFASDAKPHDDFLDDCDTRSAEGTKPFVCHDNLGDCEDAFHAVQVWLENEECEGCAICTEYRLSVPEVLS
jgi:hypothetical protein